MGAVGHASSPRPTAPSAWPTWAAGRRSSSSDGRPIGSAGRDRSRWARATWPTRYLRSDPPTAAQLAQAREHVTLILNGLEPPRPPLAIAVGGSATSLRALAGDVLDASAFTHSLDVLMSDGSSGLAARLGLDADRVRLLPAGLLILRAAPSFSAPGCEIGRGGIREGVLLEAGAMTTEPPVPPREALADVRCASRRAATAGSSACSTPSTTTSRSRPGGTCPPSTPPGAWGCPTTPGSTSRSC